MDDYKKIAEKAVEGKKEKMPKHNGSVAQYQKRYEVFVKLITEADSILKEVGNTYIKEKKPTLEEIEMIRDINKKIIESYITYFNSNK